MSNQGLIEVFSPYEAAQMLLAQTGLSDISKTLLAGTSGLAVQALVTGSVLQLVHRYFQRQARLKARSAHGGAGTQDPPLARAGVMWLTGLICVHVVLVYITNARVLLMSQQFTAGYLMDFWLAQLSNLIFTVVLLPIFLFFAFRAWNLWSRRKAVMGLCLAAVTPAVGLGLAAAAFGLQHPYPLEQIDNSAFAAWLPFFISTIKKLQWITLASSAAQFIAACVFSGLICTGLFAHKNCCAIMPGFSGKLAFVAGESLFPLVITSGAILAGDVITKVSVSPIGPLISRAVHSCAPAIYFHCLMNSLTSAQRYRDTLRGSMSAHRPSLGDIHGGDGQLSEKMSEDDTFCPVPEDLDTPLEVEYNPSSAKGRFNLPNIFTTRPKDSLPTSFSDSAPATAPSGSLSAKLGSFTLPSPIRMAFNRGPAKEAEEPEDHYTLRSAGSGRRSSLARACSYGSAKAGELKSMSGLSIKLNHNKLPLPIVSFQPPLDRRESEQIFVAHEEFEGLPHTPGDGMGGGKKGLSLNDIEEGGSDAALTPKYFTPPRIASPSPMFGGEWKDENRAGPSKAPDFGRSPESVYEAQVGQA
ncbi:uncharacterized protein MKK02DRAFT_45165 [Dioszegia hungarica]|uniref:Uncharacterized protein n=1 Tax=Dioszegia hungarica TaxID=4972 RepID=A0AA38H8X7_9TREE|nr:uncharacterized protein MKK02DRAFT_45165 [Dioszegia hungarica]KAI9636458.1 hypothetical protein MKK02DRAFT_45165 [Dioszegia hungarica]